jgi:hypothetical protein
VFSVWSAPGLHKEGPGPAQRNSEGAAARCSREAEESPLLRSVTRKRLLKTLQAGDDSACDLKCGD